MNLLDENIREDQRMLLRNWRIPSRQIGREFSRSGIQDQDIIPLLHRLKRPTFFSHDAWFHRRELVHPSYSLVWLDVFDGFAASSIRRFLRHPEFRTHAQRLGKVIRVHPEGVQCWEAGRRGLTALNWSES